jgi:hypothetical protein
MSGSLAETHALKERLTTVLLHQLHINTLRFRSVRPSSECVTCTASHCQSLHLQVSGMSLAQGHLAHYKSGSCSSHRRTAYLLL